MLSLHWDHRLPLSSGGVSVKQLDQLLGQSTQTGVPEPSRLRRVAFVGSAVASGWEQVQPAHGSLLWGRTDARLVAGRWRQTPWRKAVRCAPLA